MYDKCGYIEIVGRAAEQAMVDAVQEVKNLPQYNADEGEVSHNVAFMNHTIFSGSSLMRGMTPPPTPTILLCLVSLESMTKQFTCHRFFNITIYVYTVHIRYLVFQPIRGQNTQSPKQESWHVRRMFYRKLWKTGLLHI